ncbi:MAG: topoisomerase DNA-binding C4 zinc finger domain-containing protein [Lachnospiraceae bacterium]|nr:topoisomerase DNA-binding C4 zinc finger domain-containing protein [Lachnospiraceae bacterium]
MLSSEMGNLLRKYVPDYVVFDLETTGISYVKDQVVEISAIKVKNSVPVDEFTTLVNPMMHIPEQATAVNKITDEMVMSAPTFEFALQQFLDFIGDMVLVGHNIHSFDMKFIYRDSMRFFGQMVGNDYIDTLMIARNCLPGMRHHTLSDLANHFAISTEGAHRALNDCRMNQMVFEKLRKEMEKSVRPESNIKRCPVCGSVLKLRSGKFGDFWGCTGYPNCRYTEKVR